MFIQDCTLHSLKNNNLCFFLHFIISHEFKTPLDITVQFDPIGDNTWMNYKTFKVLPNIKFEHKFSNLIQARWIRFISNKGARLTTWLEYNTKP